LQLSHLAVTLSASNLTEYLGQSRDSLLKILQLMWTDRPKVATFGLNMQFLHERDFTMKGGHWHGHSYVIVLSVT